MGILGNVITASGFAPKIWAIAGGVTLLGLGAVGTGLEMWGHHRGYQEKSNEVAAADLKNLQEAIAKALVLNDKLTATGAKLAETEGKIDQKTETRYQTQVRYAQAHPAPASCALDPAAIELRAQQIDEIYRSAGRALPEERNRQAVTPTPSVPHK